MTISGVRGTPAGGTVTADGSIQQYPGSPSYVSFTVSASDDGTGAISGTFNVGGPSPANGSVSCMTITGNTAVVGGYSNGPSGPGGQPQFVTFYFQDAASGGSDTAYIYGPTYFGTPCSGPPPPPQDLMPVQPGGSIVISTGAGGGSNGAVSVVGNGSVQRGFGTADNFEFVAIDDGIGGISGKVRMNRNDRRIGRRRRDRVSGSMAITSSSVVSTIPSAVAAVKNCLRAISLSTSPTTGPTAPRTPSPSMGRAATRRIAI